MMAHLTPDELREYAHGWLDDPENAIAQAHVESCAECAKTAVKLSAERNLLREAADLPSKEEPMTALAIPMPAARPHVPARAGGMAVTLAAAVLGAFAVGFLVRDPRLASPPPARQDVAGESAAGKIRRFVRDFVGADAAKAKAAKAELLKTGKPSIRILIEERRSLPIEKFRLIGDLLLTIKFQGDRSEAAMNFQKILAHARVGTDGTCTVEIENLAGSLFNQFQTIYDGPPFEKSTLTHPAEIGPDPFRYELIDYCLSELQLDYAVRFGRIIVSTPDRLWPYPATSTRKLPEKEVDKLIAALNAEGIADRDVARHALLGADADLADTLKARLPLASAEQQAHLNDILAEIAKRQQRPAYEDTCTMDTQKPGEKSESAFNRLKDFLEWGEAPEVSPTAHGGASFRISGESITPLREWNGLRLDLTLLKFQDAARVRLRFPEMLADARLATFSLTGVFPLARTTVRDGLVLLAKFSGTDFCFREGEEPSIWFDAPEEIKKLAK